jgi:hypothetical protein
MLAGFMTVPAAPSAAESKPWVFGWGDSHWETLDSTRPYLHDSRIRHNRQWDDRTWTPSDWLAQRGGDGLAMVESFYVAGILSDQYRRNKVPVLEVGPEFHALGGYDKRRIVRLVDKVYGVTVTDPRGIFRLRDGETGRYIGLYSRRGLMLE